MGDASERRMFARVLNVHRVAARWDVSVTTVYREIRAGRLRGFKVGGVWRVPLAEVIRYERESGEVPADGDDAESDERNA